MDYRLKSVLVLFILIVLLAIIFSLIYYNINKNSEDPQEKGYLNSLYTSITIQTNIGMKSEPTKKTMKYWIMVQSVISYFITVGFLFVIFKYMFTNGYEHKK
jgi:hypothetical protein